ncbi:PFL_4695 family integrating conjugative element protein [Photobacterium leiognathi]|uniref:PFL_4695 family integrating conjugative element protein n=1 Tax=Photobacterium leiognathi TaxID=553611 RepID=UPI002982435D|nr:integrating conjugative element protein [Photobacterium leiognathi]
MKTNKKVELSVLLALGLVASFGANAGTELQQLQSGHIATVNISSTLGEGDYQDAMVAAKTVTMADLANEVKKHQLNESQTKDALYNSIFPLHTPSMSVSRNVPYHAFTKEYPFVPTLAIVGSDPYSIDWLKHNKQRIKTMNAVTILVDANSDHDYQKVLVAANGLEVIPVSAGDLTKDFGIKNYPVLMNKLGYGQ